MDPDERRFWKWASRNPTQPIATGVPDHCWIWVGSRNSHKVPLFSIKGKTVLAATWLYEREVAPKPTGMMLSPLCEQSMCVRPSHRQLRPKGSHVRKATP